MACLGKVEEGSFIFIYNFAGDKDVEDSGLCGVQRSQSLKNLNILLYSFGFKLHGLFFRVAKQSFSGKNMCIYGIPYEYEFTNNAKYW